MHNIHMYLKFELKVGNYSDWYFGKLCHTVAYFGAVLENPIYTKPSVYCCFQYRYGHGNVAVSEGPKTEVRTLRPLLLLSLILGPEHNHFGITGAGFGISGMFSYIFFA